MQRLEKARRSVVPTSRKHRRSMELKKTLRCLLTRPKTTASFTSQISATGRRARRGGATGGFGFLHDLSPSCRFQRTMKCYTTETAAEMLNLCEETLRRLCREGAQHRRVGRRILFTESDIAALLESKIMRDEVNPFARKAKVQEEAK